MTDPGPIRRSPPLSIGLAVGTGGLATVALASVPVAAGIGAVGVALLAAGLFGHSRRLLELSALALGAGVVSGGALGATVPATAFAALCAIVAWDVADHGFELGAQIGRNAETRRNELTHAGGSLVVGALTAAVAYGTFVGMAGGQPITALVFLLCGAVALVLALS